MNSFRAALAELAPSPRTQGTVLQLARRPREGVHERVEELHLCPDRGVLGDRWAEGSWVRLPDGSPDPRVQVSLTNSRSISLFAGSLEAALHCGDNLFVDFDLSEGHLPAGSRLQVGTAVLEVSDVINDACSKFAKRFGAAAFECIREPEHAPLRLRGLFCRIREAGTVRLHDSVNKI